MADLVAIASIAASSTVAVLVPLVSAGLERRKLLWGRMHQTRDELRAVMDEAGVALTAVLLAIDQLRAPSRQQPLSIIAASPSEEEAARVDRGRGELGAKLDVLWRSGLDSLSDWVPVILFTYPTCRLLR